MQEHAPVRFGTRQANCCKRAIIMNRRIFGLVATFSLAALPVLGDLEVTTSVQIHATVEFDAPLAAHGTWVHVGSYGRCWRPAHVAVEWRPYASGEWVWTDCGWYWSSDEPWGWACYHYGCWVYDSSVGWVWVPGVKWAPAWVSWRVGGGYIGWAPLGPPGVIFASYPHADHFVFVATSKFGVAVRPGSVIVKNSAVFQKTAEVGGLKRESRSFGGPDRKSVMVNHGPNVEMVQKASGRTFTSVPIREAARGNAGHMESKHSVAQSSRPQSKSVSELDVRSEHGRERAEANAHEEVKSGPQHGPESGGDAGFAGAKGRGGRSNGGGHGKR